jgi:hypothetical protein
MSLQISLYDLLIADESVFPLHYHPNAKIGEAWVEKCLQERNICIPNLHYINTMTSYMYPTVELDALKIAGYISAMLYYIDDNFGDLPELQGVSDAPIDSSTFGLVETCIEALRFGQLKHHSHSAVQAFSEIHDLLSCTPKSWFNRFAQSMSDHLLSSLYPHQFGWKPKTAMSIEEYALVREPVSGMYTSIDQIEFCHDVYFDEVLVSHPTVKLLRQQCTRIGSLSNDLFSYEKEVLSKGLGLNLLAVLQHTMNFDQALQTVLKYLNQLTEDFLETIAKSNTLLPTFYLDGLKYQVSATWHWQINTNRYRSTQSPFIELRTLIVD